MKEDLELLRKLRGLGLDRPRITTSDDGQSGVITIRIEAQLPWRPETISIDRMIPTKELDHPTMSPAEVRKYEYEDLYIHLRDALTQTFHKRTTGDVVLHGYCEHCGKTALYTIPKAPQTPKPEGKKEAKAEKKG